LIVTLESTLRLLKFKVYECAPSALIDCEPNNWVSDSLLGFSNKPGKITCDVNGLPFLIHHLADSSRATSLTDKKNNLPSIHIYGCSITWGHGLDDDATMAWMLQEKLPDFHVQNFGIGAGSNVQSYLWLKKNIQKGNIPDIVIVNYTWFHNMRNSFNWPWRKVWQSVLQNLSLNNSNETNEISLPYAKINGDSLTIDYLQKKDINKNLPGIKYAVLLNTLNEIYQTNLIDNKTNDFDITYKLFIAFKELCDKYKIQLVVNGITSDEGTKKMLEKLENHNILVNDISVDFLTNKEYNLQPYDGHPNKRANEHFALLTLNFLFEKHVINKYH
jgi:hypothetical protein